MTISKILKMINDGCFCVLSNHVPDEQMTQYCNFQTFVLLGAILNWKHCKAQHKYLIDGLSIS